MPDERNYNLNSDLQLLLQSYSAATVTDADAVEIRHNLVCFVNVLLLWDEQANSNGAGR